MLQEMPQFAPRAFWLCYLYRMDPEVQIAESRVCALQFKAYLKVTSPPNTVIGCNNFNYYMNLHYYQQFLKVPIFQSLPLALEIITLDFLLT